MTVLLADYALVDQANKVNILGAGWQITGSGPNGVTPQQALVVCFEVPPAHLDEQFAISMTLCDVAGVPVQVPGPTGEMQPLRAQQLVQAARPQVPGLALPNTVSGRGQIVLTLINGLPLSPGNYVWKVEVDGNANPQWEASFYVVGPPPPPVFGGPSGPANIPNLTPL